MADPLKYWLSSPFGAAIQSHINNGLKVFPLHGIKEDLTCTCGNPKCGKNSGKHPYSKTAPNGFQNATGNIEEAAELFEYRIDLNVGVATGETSGIFVIDVDDKNDGEGTRSLQKLIATLGELPDTMVLTTGNGYHIIFDYPVGVDLRNGTSSFGDEYPDVDTRGNGGYIVIYPSRHFTGRYYERGTSPDALLDLPASYLNIIKDGKPKQKKTKAVDRFQNTGEQSEWTPDDIRGALAVLDPDMNYMDWIFIGMGLHRDGFDLDLWDEWSSRGSKYKGIGDLDFHWKSFHNGGTRTIGTIIEWATLQGWHPERHHEPRVISEAAEAFCEPLVKKMLAKSKKENILNTTFNTASEGTVGNGVALQNILHPEPQKKQKPIKEPLKIQEAVYVPKPRFDFDPLTLPGAIGDTVRWITKYAIHEQPELALLNTMAFAGAVFGRRYASPIDTRTNVYLVGIARTGGGKDHSRKMLNSIALDSGLSHFMGGNSIRSDTGMLRGLMNNSCQLLQIDEFGLFMQALSDPKAGYHIKSVSRTLTSLYSDSNSAYHHGEYADAKAATIKIVAPNLCIFGTTTEESYVPALRRSAIRSGELNRYIVIPSREDIELKRHIPMKEKDEDLIAWWNQFAPNVRSSLGVNINNATTVPAPITAEWGDCEEIQFRIRKEQTDRWKSTDPFRDLWSRLHENVIKLAMIFAIARDPVAPKFAEIDFDYAYNMVRISIEYMAALAVNCIAETPQETSHLEILSAIKEAGSITRRDMLRKFRKYKKREMDDIVGTMVEEEVVQIQRVVPDNGGRPYVVYHHMTDEDEAAA